MRYNLKDTTFLIYARIDSNDRLLNLRIVIDYIKKYFTTKIYLLEVDSSAKVEEKIINRDTLTYRFIKDGDIVFHTTKYRNLMLRYCKTPYFYVCDTDVIPSPTALFKAILLLRKAVCKTLIYPYNGDFINVPSNIRDIYAKILDYEWLENKKNECTLWFRYSVGGIFGGNTSAFNKFNMDNENIYGWGPDDKERYYRLKKVGFEVVRFDFPLFHLEHQRNINSKPSEEPYGFGNMLEYFETFNFDN